MMDQSAQIAELNAKLSAANEEAARLRRRCADLLAGQKHLRLHIHRLVIRAAGRIYVTGLPPDIQRMFEHAADYRMRNPRVGDD